VARRRLPGNLRGGMVVLGGLALLAVTAPLLATDAPWMARGPDGFSLPAFRVWLGGDATANQPSSRTVVRAPIPHDPNGLDLAAVLQPPSARNLMGTDALGRDMAARVLHGAQVSLSVGLLSAAFALMLGLPLGALAGYRGGWADAAVSRSIETILCFPTLLLVLALLASAPAWFRAIPEVPRIALVLGLTGWVPVTRYLRAEFLKLKTSDMVAAARAAGCGHLRIVARHILPCSLAPVLVTTAFAVGAAIALESALSFLGLGIRPPVATWGGLLADAREQVDRAWWLALFPGVALFLAILSCNLIGEGIRDLLDPRRRSP